MGLKKNGREITKLALSVSFFFHSSGVFVSSNQICIYYDSSRFALLWLFFFCFVMNENGILSQTLVMLIVMKPKAVQNCHLDSAFP